ncbi:MAG: hypothetical protein Q8R87_00575, partial [Anaerolineaceae bacterium]|nr:hypothetical protein [Anaerolineaceae bacterium]
LPILHDGKLIARMDAKSHRADKKFEVKSLHFEPWVAADQHLAQNLVSTLSNCAVWHKSPELFIEKCDPLEFLVTLQQENAKIE